MAGIPCVPPKPLPAESMSVTEHARDFLRRRCCAACGDEFFLYEKMGRRAIDREGNAREAGSKKSVQTLNPHPLYALKKMGIQGDASTMRRQRRISEFGEAEFLGAS